MEVIQSYACEAVSEGHPDKVCDQIVDTILDECYSLDSHARVGCEALATNNNIFITGEFRMKSMITNTAIKNCVYKVLRSINYQGDPNIKLDDVNIHIYLQKQSPELWRASGGKKKMILPNDQGIVIGYACNYFLSYFTDYMPIAMSIANWLVFLASKLRKEGVFINALPDMKSQVNYHYKNGDKRLPIIDSIVMSIQHKDDYHQENFKSYVRTNIIDTTLKKFFLLRTDDNRCQVFINPSGNFTTGGWYSDSGLSGRKIVVDAYGPGVPDGGGSLSGKDITKIDRIGNYYARYIAKNLVAAELCDEIKVEISYIISYNNIAGLNVDSYGTSKIKGGDKSIHQIVLKIFSLLPEKMVQELKCSHHKFVQLAKYGHYGWNAATFPWEQLNKVKEIRKLAKILNK